MWIVTKELQSTRKKLAKERENNLHMHIRDYFWDSREEKKATKIWLEKINIVCDLQRMEKEEKTYTLHLLCKKTTNDTRADFYE